MKYLYFVMISILGICSGSYENDVFIRTQNPNIETKSEIHHFEYGGGGGGGVTPAVPQEQYAEFRSECDLYGISIDKQWHPYCRNKFIKKTDLRYDTGYLQYQTDIQQILLQNENNSNIFSVVYRVVTSPVGRRNWGFCGIGSHSDTWYTSNIKTSANLGNNKDIGQWAPKNEHANFSGSIGVGLSSNGPSISTSVNFNISQLNVISRTNVATSHYETEFDITANSNYNLYSAIYVGFFTFIRDTSSVSPIFDLQHTVSYYGSEYFHLESRTYNISLDDPDIEM
ncbi:MAG: hypothetical protein RR342_04460 [Bacilli bacterium]